MRRRAFFMVLGVSIGIGLGFAAAKHDWPARLLPHPAQAATTLSVPAIAYGPQKVVYHVNEKAAWYNPDSEAFRLVRVINNHLRAVGPDQLSVAIVFHGNGIDGLRRAKNNPQLAGMFDDLRRKGVAFHICVNTLTAQGLSLDALHGVHESDLVPAGVAEIVRLESEGFHYIRF